MAEADDGLAVVVAERAARAAGGLLRRLGGTDAARARPKGGHEIVTDADLRADALIREVLAARFPTHRVVSEETWDGWQDGMFDGPVWVVDPMDGSANFAHGYPYVSVSVAFAVDGVVRAGAVHAPFLGHTFTAVKGGGARRNGRRLAAADTSALGDALVSTGFPHQRGQLDPVLERVRRLVLNCRDVRRAGSPALDIALVAAGMLDAHTESLAPWDVAAAALVATEAGARRGNLLPEPFPLSPDLSGTGIVVAAPGVYDALCALLAEEEHPAGEQAT
ncbi:inositol monophosphatase family protein [Actinacidiphila yanglinensis]|uniref:inositol monophosphatase family protein n=1 Tax=Actinacidiphila yanglinensis TaxID=310779 RepID=UPI00135A8777|nr:inositol monophosphatase family protein [Actinacidiphila yanglinensis]